MVGSGSQALCYCSVLDAGLSYVYKSTLAGPASFTWDVGHCASGGTTASCLTPGKGPCECFCVSLPSHLVHPELSSSWYKSVLALQVLLSSFLLKCNSSLEGICMSLKDAKLLSI